MNRITENQTFESGEIPPLKEGLAGHIINSMTPIDLSEYISQSDTITSKSTNKHQWDPPEGLLQRFRNYVDSIYGKKDKKLNNLLNKL